MIYLIDDNRSRQQESYGCSFIKDGVYKDHLTHFVGVPTPERADFLEELPSKAKAVFYHTTSKDLDRDGNFLESAETIKKVSKKVKEKDIPFVGFSWGHTSHNALFDNNNIELMNKRIFYLNLREFIEDYIEVGSMDFQILAKGIGYKKEILIEQARRLIKKIQEENKSNALNMTISEEDNFIPELEIFLHESSSEQNFQSLCLKYSNKLTRCELIDLLNKSITSIRKYGRNLHC